ncbi:EexN family lipoprotein [Enterobacter cloacae]|uniref:EexN family lipoprotein n=1 Tax=Enterobacter cloacae TaxID=550 RepID=UPI002FF736DE
MKMNMKAALFVALTSIAALTGCDDKTSVEWYMAHHDDMLKKYEECYISHTWEAEDCFHAKTAYHRERNNPDVAKGYQELVERADKARQ